MGKWAPSGLLPPLGTLSSLGSPGCSNISATTQSPVPDLCLLVQLLRNQEGSCTAIKTTQGFVQALAKVLDFSIARKIFSISAAHQSLKHHQETLHLDTLLQTSCRLDAPRHFRDCTHFQVCFGISFPKSIRNN